jgi:hypothetical protein
VTIHSFAMQQHLAYDLSIRSRVSYKSCMLSARMRVCVERPWPGPCLDDDQLGAGVRLGLWETGQGPFTDLTS